MEKNKKNTGTEAPDVLPRRGEVSEQKGSGAVFAALIIFYIVLTVLARLLDRYYGIIGSNVLYSDTFKNAVGISLGVLQTFVLAAAGGAVTFCAVQYRKSSAPFILAAAFSAVLAADRVFFIVYNLSKYSQFYESGMRKSGDLYKTILPELAIYIVSYFAAAFLSRLYVMSRSGKDDVYPQYRCAFYYVLTLTLLEAVYQTFLAAPYIFGASALSGEEIVAVITDYLFVVLKYGVVMFALVILVYFSVAFAARRIASGRLFHRKKGDIPEKNKKTDDKRKKV